MRLPRRLGHGEEAQLVDHLGELRARVLISLFAVAVGFAAAYAVHGRLIDLLNAPLPADLRPVTLGVGEPFMTSVKVSLYAGFGLALPVVLWQVWAYFAPALGPSVQRTLGVLVGAASVLFLAGVAFGYGVALPAAIEFLTSFDADRYDIEVRAKDYYSFALMVLLAVGLVFELPIFVLALVRLGVVTTEKLRRNRRTGYVAMAVLAVALPGIDPVTTAFEMVPLIVLYEASIWLSVALEKRRRPVAAPGLT